MKKITYVCDACGEYVWGHEAFRNPRTPLDTVVNRVVHFHKDCYRKIDDYQKIFRGMALVDPDARNFGAPKVKGTIDWGVAPEKVVNPWIARRGESHGPRTRLI